MALSDIMAFVGIGIELLGGGIVILLPNKRYIGWLMVISGLLFIFWPFKDRIHWPSPKEPAKIINYTETEKEKPIIETLAVGYRADSPEILTMLGNRGNLDLSKNANVSLGLIHFEENETDDGILWINSQNKVAIKSGQGAVFSFMYPIRKSMFVITKVESPELKNGLMIDYERVAYTWDYWKPGSWGWWPQNSAYVGETARLEKLLGKYKRNLK